MAVSGPKKVQLRNQAPGDPVRFLEVRIRPGGFMKAPPLRLFCRVAATSLVVAHSLPAQVAGPPASPSGRPPSRIVIDHLSRAVEVWAPGGGLVGRWSGSDDLPIAALPAGSPIEVMVTNANPLLYRYALQSNPVARKTLPACRTLGGRVVTTGALASFATISAITQPMLMQGMGQLFAPPPSAVETATRGELLVTTSMLETAMQEHGPPLEHYAEFLAAIRSVGGTIEDSLALIAELGEAQPVDSLLGELQGSLDRMGLGRSTRVPLAVRVETEAAKPHFDALAPLVLAIQRGNYEGDASAGLSQRAYQMVAAVEAGQQDLPAAYRTLQRQLSRVETARAQTTQVFRAEQGSEVRRLTLEVEPTAEFTEVYRGRAGRIEIFTEPTVGFLCQVSLAVGFMDRPPTYTLQGNVVQQRSDGTRTGVGLLVHLATAKVPVVGVLAGIGFGSEGGPDLYAGGTLRLLDPLMVNFGAVWQRTQQLPDGFAVGQPAPDPGLMLNLPTKYQAGFFWGVSIAR